MKTEDWHSKALSFPASINNWSCSETISISKQRKKGIRLNKLCWLQSLDCFLKRLCQDLLKWTGMQVGLHHLPIVSGNVSQLDITAWRQQSKEVYCATLLNSYLIATLQVLTSSGHLACCYKKCLARRVSFFRILIGWYKFPFLKLKFIFLKLGMFCLKELKYRKKVYSLSFQMSYLQSLLHKERERERETTRIEIFWGECYIRKSDA